MVGEVFSEGREELEGGVVIKRSASASLILQYFGVFQNIPNEAANQVIRVGVPGRGQSWRSSTLGVCSPSGDGIW